MVAFTLSRRQVINGTLGLAAAASLSRPAHARTSIRLSYQLSSALLLILREHRTLEDRLASAGFDIEWSRFSSDTMRMGAGDLHSDVAEAVPLFTTPANPALTLYAAEGPSPQAVALVVHDDSPIHALADLRGRTIGTSKGSASHCLLVRTLDRAGLSLSDVHPVFLAAPDGAAAFQTGHIDAWATYDPFLAMTESNARIRVLADGAAAAMRYDRYYLVNADFAKAHPQIVQVVFDGLQQAAAWIHDQPDDANSLLARLWGDVPLETVRRVNRRRVYEVRAIGKLDVQNLDALDATFVKAGVIRSPVAASGIPIWQPKPV